MHSLWFMYILQRSWSDKIIERVRNVIKTDNRKARQAGECGSASVPTKRQKKVQETELTRRYPVVSTNMDIEDPSTISRHEGGIAEELAKTKPRDTVLLPLLKKTYGERRLFIVNSASSITDIKTRYPALSRPAVVRSSCSNHVQKYILTSCRLNKSLA